MPGERDPLDERFERLQNDIGEVPWADLDTIRARARRRVRARAIAGTTVVCLAVGFLGLGVTGNLPGGRTFLVDQPLGRSAAGTPGDTATAAPTPTRSSERPDSPRPKSSRHSNPPAQHTTPGHGTGPGNDHVPPPSTPPDHTPTADPTTTGSPSPTPTATAPSSVPAGPKSLLVASEMPALPDGGTWSETATKSSEGSSATSCTSSTLDSLGATSTARRDFGAATGGSTPAPNVTGATVVGVFATSDDASAAYDRLASAIGGCAGSVTGPTSASAGDAAQWWVASGDSSYEVVGTVRRGTALTLVVWRNASSSTFDGSSDAMPGSLSAASDRLQPYAGGN